jgi:hypothetical protein
MRGGGLTDTETRLQRYIEAAVTTNTFMPWARFGLATCSFT